MVKNKVARFFVAHGVQINNFIIVHATLNTTTFPVCPILTTGTHIELLPTPLPQTPHGHLTAFCVTFCHSH